MTRTTSQHRVPLSRDLVLQTAVTMADAHGIDALTMRGLAGQLQVEAMSLYNHVNNKDDILDGMIEIVAAEIEDPDDAADWKTRIRQRAISAHDALQAHPWSSILWTSRNIGPARMRYMDAMLRELREAGFSLALLDVAFHTLENHIVGHALHATNFPFDVDDLPALSVRYLESFPAGDYPDLAAHIRHHIDVPAGEISSFEFGLDAILDALDRGRR